MRPRRRLADDDLRAHGPDIDAIDSVSIDMSPAFIKGCADSLPNARITFDKFHVIAHASRALDETRRIEQKTTPGPQGVALEVAAQLRKSQRHRPRGSRRPARQTHYEADRPSMGVP